MAFGLYKPGQGYWVRVMSAVMAGMIILAASGWVWNQIGALELPYGSWRLTLSTIPAGAAAPAPGSRVDLIAERGTAGLGSIGSAEVADYEASGSASGLLTISDIKIDEPAKYDPSLAKGIRAGGDAFSATVAGAQGVPLVEPLYLQAGAVAAVMVIGAILTYWIIGVRPRTAEFLIATDGEMKKVNWSSWKDIRGSTLVVTSASFLIAAGLFGVDFVFSTFFKLIGVLEQ